MKKVNFKNRNGQGVTIAAVINFPEGFDEGKKYPAVVVSHPGGGVKEQTAGLYAKKLASAPDCLQRRLRLALLLFSATDVLRVAASEMRGTRKALDGCALTGSVQLRRAGVRRA